MWRLGHSILKQQHMYRNAWDPCIVGYLVEGLRDT